MKTLILNGSPRKNGDTITLLSEIKRHLAGDIRMVSAYHDHIKPCIDCRFCWEHSGCAIQDDMQTIYEEMNDYDNVIIASPVYMSELTGPLLSLASRFQTYYAASHFRKDKVRIKKKNGILVLVGGGDGTTEGAERSAKFMFRYMNASCVGEVRSLNTNEVPAMDDGAALEAAKEMAMLLNRLSGISGNV